VVLRTLVGGIKKRDHEKLIELTFTSFVVDCGDRLWDGGVMTPELSDYFVSVIAKAARSNIRDSQVMLRDMEAAEDARQARYKRIEENTVLVVRAVFWVVVYVIVGHFVWKYW
jgi:hypothetical protein